MADSFSRRACGAPSLAGAEMAGRSARALLCAQVRLGEVEYKGESTRLGGAAAHFFPSLPFAFRNAGSREVFGRRVAVLGQTVSRGCLGPSKRNFFPYPFYA